MRLRTIMAVGAVFASTIGALAVGAPAQAAATCGAPLYQADWVRFVCSGSGYAFAEIRCAAPASGGVTRYFPGDTKATPAHVYADCPDGWNPIGSRVTTW